MRLLDRYLLRELLAPLGFCLGGFLIVWVSFDMVGELRNFQARKLHGADVLEYYLIKTPEFLVTVLPIALLLAMLYALGNHARHNELTAMRSAGISLWRLAAPYFGVGLACSFALLLLNEFCVPNADHMAEQLLNRRLAGRSPGASPSVLRNLGFTNSRDGRTWQVAAYNLKTFEMTDPKVDWELPNGSHGEIIAKRAVRTNNVWVFYDAWLNTYAAGSGELTNRNHFATLPMPGFSETPEQIRSEIKISERLSKRGTKRADIPLVELLDYLRLHPDASPEDKAWLYTKLHGRLAAPLTCLVVVLVAIPFGAGSGRRNVFVGVASSIGICFAYFVLLQVGLALGAGGHLPAWLAAWLPNISFGLVALGLTMRVR